MRCKLCDTTVRHMRYKGRESEYICRQCLYFTDLNIRWLVPSEELTEYKTKTLIAQHPDDDLNNSKTITELLEFIAEWCGVTEDSYGEKNLRIRWDGKGRNAE